MIYLRNNNLLTALMFRNLKVRGEMVTDDQAQRLDEILLNSFKEDEETELKIKKILVPELEEKLAHNEQVKETVNVILSHPDFYEMDGKLYHSKVKLSIPMVLAVKMKENFDNPEELNKLINFWCWVSLNPDAESRENIYQWVKKQNIPILPSGLILTFRRVVKVEGVDYTLTEYVNETYLKLRKSKKSTTVNVYKNDESYNLKEGDLVGVLKDIYNTPQEEVYYTSNHDKTVKYYIGQEVRMSRENVDSDKNNECSTGYHSAGPGFAYRGFGDTPVAVTLNPADVLVVYENNFGKARSSAFTIVGVLKEDAEWAEDKEMLEVIEENTQYHIDRMNKLIAAYNPNDTIQQQLYVSQEGLDVNQLPGFFEIKSILN